MQSTADLNLAAEKQAELYDEVVMLKVDSLDLADIASGGEAQAITYGAGGAAGPTSETPAATGVAWSDLLTFDLTEVAHFAGFLRDDVIHYTEALESPKGPGEFGFIHGIGPGATDED